MSSRSAAAYLAVLALAACGPGPGTSDASTDGASDGARDAGGLDSSRGDLGTHDAGACSDGGPCSVGLACASGCACPAGLMCQEPLGGTPATATVVYDCTPGVDGSVAGMSSGPLYGGGACTNASIVDPRSVLGAAGACNPNLASDEPAHFGEDGCPACSKCVLLPFARANPVDPPYVQCMARCTPPADPTCTAHGPGWECDVFTNTCQPFGCQDDISCQEYDEDTNGDGFFMFGTDRICHDGTGGHCNSTSARCEHPAHAGAFAGSPCMRDSECEENGQCLSELRQGFEGGYCTSFGCNVPGLACATASDKCQDVGQNGYLCVQRCTVDAEAPSLVLGVGGHGDTCRPGYQCLYDDVSGTGVAGNGGCWPGNYNDVVTNNVGHACPTSSADPGSGCYSPHGAGRCIFSGLDQMCSILGCAGYPPSEDICGTGNHCVVSMDGSSACLPL